MEAAAARVTAEPRGLVRIGCPLGVERLLAERLPELMRRYPRLRVQVMVGNRRLDLIEERIDVALRVRETLDGDADVVIRQLARGHACLVASPALLDERDPPSIPAELATWPTISQSEQSGYHRWHLVDGEDHKASVDHEPRVAATEFAILLQAAIDGLGVAFLAHYACRAALDDGRLVRILPTWRSREANIHLAFPSRRGMLPGVRATVDFLAETFAVDSPAWRLPV